MTTSDLPWIVPSFIALIAAVLRYAHLESKVDILKNKVDELKEENSRLRERADKTK